MYEISTQRSVIESFHVIEFTVSVLLLSECRLCPVVTVHDFVNRIVEEHMQQSSRHRKPPQLCDHPPDEIQRNYYQVTFD